MGRELVGASMFSGGGLGDLAMRSQGVRVVAQAELTRHRAALLRRNFPTSTVVEGDLLETLDEFVGAVQEAAPDGLDVLLATPPCQGMSKNGRASLVRSKGTRDGQVDDPRNDLHEVVTAAVRRLRPRLLVVENVPEMAATKDRRGRLIPDALRQDLGGEYDVGEFQVVNFADYGVPQRRSRLVASMFRKDVGVRRGDAWCHQTHSREGSELLGLAPWVTVGEVLATFPPLDAGTPEGARHPDLPWHRVPVLDARKYWWVSCTPPRRSAFENQCVRCKYDGNPTREIVPGPVRRWSRDTPVHCAACGELLPRPVVEEDGELRIMRGFGSIYKRMEAALPASTLTQNLSFACSDQKLHPTQHRVLSLREAMAVHTLLDYDYAWEDERGREVPDQVIREVIGESVPPAGFGRILEHLLGCLSRP